MKRIIRIQIFVVCSVLMIFALVMSACAPATAPATSQDVSPVQTQAAQTVVADLTKNAPPPPATSTVAAAPGATPDPNLPVAMLLAPASGEPAAVARYNTTIMGGPGKNYVVYGAFLGGMTAKVVGKSEDSLWWAVSVPVAPSGSGWVDAGWVTVTNASGVPVLPTPPVPPTTALVPPRPDEPQMKTLANVSVRSGPATNYPAYGIAPAGVTGRVIGRSEDSQWWVVRIDPQKVGVGYGWLPASYTSAQNVAAVQTIKSPQAAEAAALPAPAPGAPAGTAIEPVNVRSGPGTNYTVLAVAPAGATSEVTGKSADGQWWQVKIPAKYSSTGLGWVAAGYGYVQNADKVPVVAAPPAPPVVQPTPPSGGSSGCLLAGQTPADGTVFAKGAQFNASWVLKNTGSEQWDENEYDIVYVGAVDNVSIHSGPDRYDLTTTIEQGWTYNFWVFMLAPYDPGVYGEMWQVSAGNRAICQFYVYIEVR